MSVCVHRSEQSSLYHTRQDAFEVIQVLEEILGSIPGIRAQSCVWCTTGVF